MPDKEKDMQELAEIIKKYGEYSVELDGYVVNPATIACKIEQAGYTKPHKHTVMNDEEIRTIVEGRLKSIETLAWGHLYDWTKKDSIIEEHLEYIIKDLC